MTAPVPDGRNGVPRLFRLKTPEERRDQIEALAWKRSARTGETLDEARGNILAKASWIEITRCVVKTLKELKRRIPESL
jgi:hypothetical protein